MRGSLSPASFSVCIQYFWLEDTGLKRWNCSNFEISLFYLYNHQCQITRFSFLKGKINHKRCLCFRPLSWTFLTSEASVQGWHDRHVNLSRKQAEWPITEMGLDLRSFYATLSKTEMETFAWLQFHPCLPYPSCGLASKNSLGFQPSFISHTLFLSFWLNRWGMPQRFVELQCSIMIKSQSPAAGQAWAKKSPSRGTYSSLGCREMTDNKYLIIMKPSAPKTKFLFWVYD